MKQAAKECKGEAFKKRMHAIKDTFISHRQIGEAEAIYRLLPNFHLRDSNIRAVFVPTGFKKSRSRFLQKLNDDQITDDILDSVVKVEGQEGSFVEKSSLLEKYMRRPNALKDLTYCQFSQRYEAVKTLPKNVDPNKFVDGCYTEDTKPKGNDSDEDDDDDFDDSLGHIELDSHKKSDIDYIVTYKTKDMSKNERDKLEKLPKFMELKSVLPGEPPYMKLRKKVAIRFHKHTKGSHEYFFAENQLYSPFTEDDQEMLENETERKCRERFIDSDNNDESTKIWKVKSQLMPHIESVEEGRYMVEESENRERDIGDDLDAMNAQDKDDCKDMGVSEHPEYGLDPESLLESTDEATHDNFYRPIQVENTDELCRQTRLLDSEQRLVLDEILKYAKDLKKSESRNNVKPEPPHLMIHAGAGCGKSLLINLLAQWLELILRKSGEDCSLPYVLKCAPTGTAASIIKGQTLHRAFGFPFSNEYFNLSDKIRDEKRAQLKQLKVVIIDEISMVKSDMLYQLDLRLREITQNMDQKYGGCAVVCFGDLLQLKPVQAKFIFDKPSCKDYHISYDIEPLWHSFKVINLFRTHRQGSDKKYAEILNC